MPGGALIVAAVLLGLVIVREIAVYLRYRGRHTVACPANHSLAAIAVDIGSAVATGVVFAPKLRVASCTEWPEYAGCAEECLSQIPDAALVEAGRVRKCVSCGMPLGNLDRMMRISGPQGSCLSCQQRGLTK